MSESYVPGYHYPVALEPQCPLHGPLVGVRYCPECASMDQPWTEEQANAAYERARIAKDEASR